MERTFDPADEEFAAGRRAGPAGNDAASELKNAAAEEIRNLIADVEELVGRIGNLHDADVARVRSKVMAGVDAAKERLAERADALKRQAQRAMSEADEYVRESPWVAVGIAALVGAVVGILVARRS
ncbi:MAG TPA: hypothetical protein VK437_00055 [Steroidobacteraceae bacterium]|nr:hypothetical protein [Steroidobacteraceae bacterium]